MVIGAPNQENGGALFIHRGGSQGVSQQPSQIIQASDLNIIGIKGFGISISRAVDVDHNKYPGKYLLNLKSLIPFFFKDILIGAYQSDEAVLLRSRQVIFLTPSIKHPTFLDRKQNKFVISVCFAYLATHPPLSISKF